MHWLGKDLTTGNVVERLAICKEFGLDELSGKIVEQLTCNKQALSEVSNSQQILKYPELMVSLLQSAAATPEADQKAVGKRGSPDAKERLQRRESLEPHQCSCLCGKHSTV